jgi:NAD(P)-dependent dehydrogenase (short-subunit alcohol dehydrogenase family)
MAALAGRVALVTGGGRGIGRATALALAERGADVAVMSRSVPELEETAALVRASGRRSLAVVGNVAHGAAVHKAVTVARDALGPIDIPVNNAAVLQPVGPTIEVDPEAWGRLLEVNLTGVFRCIHAVLPAMLERGWGRIVNVSAGAATGTGLPRASAYSVSKAGLDMLTRHLAAELAGTGVGVNSVWPGGVRTRMLAAYRGLRPDDYDPAEPALLIANLVIGQTTGEVVDIHGELGHRLRRA